MLVKDDVGRPKPCTVKLPPQGFVYGKPENKIEHKGSFITGGYEQAPQQARKSTKADIDFKKVNKANAFSRNQSVSIPKQFHFI